MVRVLIPPAAKRRLPADLLLCGHHYLASKAALAAAGAVAMDETGTVVYPPSASGRIVDSDIGSLFELLDTQASSVEVFP